jgi:uridine kinase
LDTPQVELHYSHSTRWKFPPVNFSQYTHKFLAYFAYKIEFLPNRIRIFTLGNPLSIPIIHHFLLFHSLRYLISKKGFLLLHAGAVVHKENSYIFSGYSGSGKTTITSMLTESGKGEISFHSDDYIIVTPDNKSLAYQTRYHTYINHLTFFPRLKKILKPSEILLLYFFSGIRNVTKCMIRWPLRIKINRMWNSSKITTTANPAALILIYGTNHTTSKIQVAKKDSYAIEKILAMNFFQCEKFIQLIKMSDSISNMDSWLEDWKARERKSIKRMVDCIPVYDFHRSSNMTNIDKLTDWVVNH